MPEEPVSNFSLYFLLFIVTIWACTKLCININVNYSFCGQFVFSENYSLKTFNEFLQRKSQQDATLYQNFIILYFKWSSTCFGRHTAHHQEPKTAQAASGFAKPEAACAVFGSWWWAVSPETWWASFNKGIIKFWYTVASCWDFLCKNCTMMHKSINIKFTEL